MHACTHTIVSIYTYTDKNLIQLKQNLYSKRNYYISAIYNLHKRHGQFSDF